MTYERFEHLPVWQAAIELAAAVYALTELPPFRGRHSLRDQIERAAFSVCNNIAEGFERGTKEELLTFLYIARGSAGEVRSMLCLLDKLPAMAGLGNQALNLKTQVESISKQLGGWMRSLRDSRLKGERYVSYKTRRVDAARKDREEFLKELDQMRAERETRIQNSRFNIQEAKTAATVENKGMPWVQSKTPNSGNAKDM